MTMIAVFLKIDEQSLVASLEKLAEQMDVDKLELALDFSAVHRVDSRGSRAIAEFARKTEENNIKVVLRGINIDLYKTMKLMRLTRHFSFAS
jgi:anti-anti-sigma regulatory factor